MYSILFSSYSDLSIVGLADYLKISKLFKDICSYLGITKSYFNRIIILNMTIDILNKTEYY